MDVKLRISEGQTIRIVEMPGVTTMHYAAYRVADEVGILKDGANFYLSSNASGNDSVPSMDLAAEWTTPVLYLVYSESDSA